MLAELTCETATHICRLYFAISSSGELGLFVPSLLRLGADANRER